MGKYTNEQIAYMACVLKTAKENKDPRYDIFCIKMAAHTGLPINIIEQKIEEYNVNG